MDEEQNFQEALKEYLSRHREPRRPTATNSPEGEKLGGLNLLNRLRQALQAFETGGEEGLKEFMLALEMNQKDKELTKKPQGAEDKAGEAQE